MSDPETFECPTKVSFCRWGISRCGVLGEWYGRVPRFWVGGALLGSNPDSTRLTVDPLGKLPSCTHFLNSLMG